MQSCADGVHTEQCKRDPAGGEAAVRQANEIGRVSKDMPQVREHLAQIGEPKGRAGLEPAERVGEPKRELADPNTGDGSRDLCDAALPLSLAQYRHKAGNEQWCCSICDDHQVAEHSESEQDHRQSPAPTKTPPSHRSKCNKGVQSRGDVETLAKEPEIHGGCGKDEKGDDDDDPGEAC